MHSIIICKLSNQSGVFFNLNFNIFCEYVTFNNLVNGDKIQVPTYESLTQDVVVNVDGKQISLSAGSTSNPYFTIPRGGCYITATGENSGILKLSYEQEVL